MRKSFLIILFILLLSVCALAAAETEIPLDGISGKMVFPKDDVIILTPSNLSEHPDLLSGIGKSQEELLADWTERGVVLQAWSKDTKKRYSVEISVIQDDAALRYFDLNQQDKAGRNQYYKEQYAAYREKGYILDNLSYKLHSKSGYYAVFDYILRPEGETPRRGIIRKTVRNGYTLCMNFEVYDRTLRGTDRDLSQKITNYISIETVTQSIPTGLQTQSAVNVDASAEIPANAAGTLNVTSVLPDKTNTGVFTVEGTAYPGSEVIVVAMDYTKTTPGHPFNAIVGSNGKFSVKVTLPEQATYQVFINMYIGDNCVADAYISQVTYSKFALPYTLDTPIPEQISTDELVISGTTDKGVTIQCIVTNGVSTFDKTIKTNGTGKFKFKIPTKTEAEYDITVVFSKKNLSTERLNVKAVRSLTLQDTQQRAADKAKHPSYAALTRNLNSYIGETMVYESHIVNVEQVNEEWIITAALKLNKGVYSNFLYFMSAEDPGLAVGSKLKLYGTCVGAYQVQTEEGTEAFPGFDYLFSE